MRKPSWKRVVVVLGIALLAAALALMPACDTGGGDGINACEAIAGDWIMNIALADGMECEDDMSASENLANITISGSTVTIDPADSDPLPDGEITCSGNKFDIVIEISETSGSCTLEAGMLISATFSTADKFTGTMTFYKTYSGTGGDCDIKTSCEDDYTITGTRAGGR